MTTISRERWKQGQADELADWAKWFKLAADGADAQVTADLAWQTDPAANISQREYLLDYLRRHIFPGGTVSVLDVGAGPLTFFPKKWITRTVNITTVDPLAEEYAKLIAAAGITTSPPVVAAVATEAETLLSSFATDQFDLVFARNAFEQFHDPLGALRQMLGVVKPGHWVLLLQEGERTEAQSARGPWTLVEEDDEPYLMSGGQKIDLAAELTGVGDVRVVRSWHYPWLLASIRKG